MNDGAAAKGASVAVVVVDDSPVRRRLLRGLIEGGRALTVVGEARTGREGASLVERLRPAVVLMDVDPPMADGIEAIERIMAGAPTPILVCGSGDAAGAALAAGAVDVVAEPATVDVSGLDAYGDELRRQLKVASRVRVITHPRGRLRNAGAATEPASVAAPQGDSADAQRRASRRPRVDFDLIAIGVSTGGPQALSVVLRELPADLDQAVVVVQHMADGFLQGLAEWLDAQCALPVSVGESGKRLQRGAVTLAPGGHNLIVHERLRVTCEEPPPSQFHIPGIDATFASVAASLGPAAIGVILTGMGRDGAVGLKAMREQGAVTIGQDEESCAVYGMPAAARAIGAVEHERTLAEIGPLLRGLVAADSAGRLPAAGTAR